MTELWRRSASEIATLVKAKQISARDAASAAIDRMATVNPQINAVVDFLPDDALSQADRVDAAIARGESVGPLAGVPVTVKINVDQKGFTTTNGVGLQKELIAKTNSPVVDNLLAAGAVIVGRTNTPAFSYRWFTNNLVHGATHNPHDKRLTPGGSSGGAAAAVASGIGHIAHGTDIAGSIRYPAYACGVHGLRPSLGRVAAFNASSAERDIGGQIMAVSGPLARTIDDIELGLVALSRQDHRDPWWTPVPLSGPVLSKRVALCLNPAGIDTCSEIRSRLLMAARCLQDAGWTVDEFPDFPGLREAADLQLRLWLADGYETKLALAEKEGDRGALTILKGHEALGRSLTLASFSEALTLRAQLARKWQEFMAERPLLLMPVSGDLPFPDNMDLNGEEAFERVWTAQIPQIGVPFLGLPGLTVFTGLHDHIPTGVQLVAPRYREDHCISAAREIEARVGVPQVVTPGEHF